MTEPDKDPQTDPAGTPGADELPMAGRMPALPGKPSDTPEPAKDDLSDKPTVSLTRSELVPEPGDEPTRPLRRPVDVGQETRRLVPPPSAPPAPAAAGDDVGPEDEPTVATPVAAAEPSVSPEPVTAVDAGDQAVDGEPSGVPEKGGTTAKPEKTAKSVWTSGGGLIAVLLALFGFTLVVQLRSNNTDEGLASARQEDLVRILSDLESQDSRLQAEITALEDSQRKLTSGVAGREAALAEADRRAEELGLLAGTLPGQGPGLRITMVGVKASGVLNAVQELRGAGGEVMQVQGSGGQPVRIVASTYFVDAQEGGIAVDGERMAGPYTLSVIGQPQTMETALNIPGGVVASVEGDGGSVQVERREVVDVTALHKATTLQYARPVS